MPHSPDEVPCDVAEARLRAAVDTSVADLDAGNGIDIPPGRLRKHLRERGRLAAARVAARTDR